MVARRSTCQASASERRTNWGRRRAMSRSRMDRPAASRLPVRSTYRICVAAAAEDVPGPVCDVSAAGPS